MPSPLPSDSKEELLRLFWQRLGHMPSLGEERPSPRHDAARRIVVAVGPAAEAVTLAAALADELAVDLPMLADLLEQPSEETLLLTPQPPTGRALIAATAVG